MFMTYPNYVVEFRHPSYGHMKFNVSEIDLERFIHILLFNKIYEISIDLAREVKQFAS